MKKCYEWRKLTDQGLLVEPDELGPYYDRMNVNQLDASGAHGYKNEADALHALSKYLKELGDYAAEELVLITIYGTSGYPIVTSTLKFE